MGRLRRPASARCKRWSARSLELELRLPTELIERLTNMEGVTHVDVLRDTLDVPGHAGCADRAHFPLARVQRIGSDVAFVDAVPRADLRRDPSLGGLRASLEAACVARCTSYEVWTEDEIREDATVARLTCVASTRDRATRASCCGASDPTAPAIVTAIGARLGLDGLVPAGTGWVGRSRLTGIPMTLLRGLSVDPLGGQTAWRPRPEDAADPDAATVTT